MHTSNTRKRPKERDSQSGQILVLFSLMIVVLGLFVMAVVDVGFFLHERAQAQQTADAAALAGAQELPDSPDLAETVARDYVDRNGLDPDDVDISFRCTTEVESICDESAGTYDTIVVTPHSKAPAFFGGLLTIVGEGDSCWVEGCNVQALAAACRGACGPIGTGPVDVVMALDHSGSMTNTDLTNAKNAITEMFGNFNHEYHRVGLAVTPPVNESNLCDTIDTWSVTPKIWLPAELTDTFQTVPYSLNNSSPPVSVTNCVDRADWNGGELDDFPLASGHTDVGSPIKASMDELVANGRPDITWGIILITDGAANVAPTITTTTTTTTTEADDTGNNYCTSQSAVTSSAGDNNGYQSNASNTCSNGSGNGTDTDSGNGSSTSCSSTQKDKHQFRDFNLSSDIPGSATITGIEMRVDAWANIPSGATTRTLCIERSQNGGSSWTSVGNINLSGTSEQQYNLGNSSNLTGQGLTQSSFTNSNFRIRMTMVSNVTTTDFQLDAVAVKIHYTEQVTTTNSTTTYDGSLGPCDWAGQQADAAKAVGIEVFTIAWGADDACDDELPGSPYDGWDAAVFLASLATDADHAFDEPKSEDLDPIFAAIGSQLTAGSKLVE